MAINVSEGGGGGDFKKVEQGTHLAICYMVVDLGKQRTDWQGQERIRPKLYVRWELPNERMEWTDREGVQREGPMSIGKMYSASLSPKANLRADLEAWRGRAFTADELRGFDVTKLLGVPCMVSVTHAERDGKTYENVTAVAGVPKGMTRPERPENGLILYDEDNRAGYEDLPDWLRKKVDEQVIDAKPALSLAPGELDDDIPF